MIKSNTNSELYTEEELRESNERFSAAFNASPDLMSITRFSDGEILDVNDEYERLLGYSRLESIGKTTSGMSIWANMDDRGTFISKLTEYGQITNFETKLRRKDGVLIDVIDSARVIELQGEKCVLSVIHDITERKKAEDSLKESEVRLNEAQRITHLGSWELDLGNNMLTWSDEIYRIFEIDQKKFGATYEAFLNAIHPDDRKVVDDAYVNSLKTKTPYFIEHRLLFPDGRIKHVHEECETFYDVKGKSIRSVGTVQDITERKRAEQELVNVDRSLRVVSDINQTLVRVADEKMLLNETCRIAVDVGGYRMAWVGFVENDEAKTVRPVAQKGFEDGYLETANITWADTERGQGPTGVAIRTGEIVVMRNMLEDPAATPWREEAMKRGYRSSIALPLKDNGKMIGSLNIYSSEVDVFGDEEVIILKELAGDLAFGIMDRRMRDEHKILEGELIKLKKAANASGEAIFMTDREGVFTFVNPEFTRLYGHDAVDVIGKVTPRILGSGSRGAEEYKTFWEKLLLKQIVKDEHTNRTKDGRILTIESSANPILDEKEEILGFLAIQRDITERKKEEETIRKSEAALEEAQRIGNFGNFDWDARTDAILWSDEYYRIYGFEPGGKPMGYEEHLKTYTPESATRLDEAVKRSMQTGESYEVNLEQVRADGTRKWFIARGEAKRDENNKIVGLRGTAQDITERKLAEERLYELDILKDKFIQTVSHQMRTPLSVIRWQLESLLEGSHGNLNDYQEQSVRSCYHADLDVISRVNDFITVLEIEEERIPRLDKSPNCLESLWKSVEIKFKENCALKKILFESDVPEICSPLLEIDMGKLRFVMEKLAENALTYTNEGGKIKVSIKQVNMNIRFEIEDTGVGIPELEQPHIFTRFYRASNAGIMKPDASGLSLFISRYYIQAHEGAIGFTSKEGKGSTFWFELPSHLIIS